MKKPDPGLARPLDPSLLEDLLSRQRAYEDQRQTRMGQGAERLTAPFGGMIARFIPTGLVQAGLRAADRAVGFTLPRGVSGHDRDDLEACERAALGVQKWAMGGNAATGGAAGFLGAAGLGADISATIALGARNVRATAAAYGFNDDSEAEAAFRLLVMEVATRQADKGRKETLGNLRDMAAALNTPEGRIAMKKGGEWVSEKVVERIARQLGVSLAGRKAGQLVPFLGGAVEAVVNASFQADISRAARYAYRQRWLMNRTLLPAPQETR